MRLKHIAAFLLGTALTVSMIPAFVFAKEIDVKTVDRDVTQSTESGKGEDSETTYKIPFQTIKGSGKSNNDELLEEYFKNQLKSKLYIQKRSFRKANMAGARLSVYSKNAYDILIPEIEKIAKGQQNSTEITISLSELGIQNIKFSAEDVGVSSLTDSNGSLTTQAQEAIWSMSVLNLGGLVDALLADFPYELYWYDKTAGLGFSGLSYTYSSSYFQYYGQLKLQFSVSEDYAASDFQTDPNKISRVSNAIDNAAQIVNEAKGYTDLNKLKYYSSQICELNTYNTEAATNSGTPYGNPWQIIWVFDGDPTTNVVCEGYSKAFMYLCDMTSFTSSDITCITASGNCGGDHMWNIVKMDDGKNYLVDITNCDSENSVGYPDQLFLKGYFEHSSTNVYKYKTNRYGTEYTPTYTYGKDTTSTYAASQLALSATDYFETITGTCGTNLTWTLNGSGILTISGTGNMYNWSDGTNVPWYTYRSQIKKVVLQSGVTSIGDNTFNDCTALTSVDIPNLVTSIGKFAFKNCSSLTSIVIPQRVEIISSNLFESCTSLTSVTIKGRIREIDIYAFSGCTSLAAIEIPDSVTDINERAFSGCSKLKSIVIPSGVTLIPSYTFNGCSALTEITFPDTVKTIGFSAFLDCESLKKVTISNSITKIEANAFTNCFAITDVYYGSKKTDWDAISIDSSNDYLKNAKLHCTYSIVLSQYQNGTVDVKTSAYEGEKINITATPNKGCELDSIKVNGTAITGNAFTMPSADATVTVTFKKINYTITVSECTNGTATVENNTANYGDLITITITPDTCYELDTVTVNGVAVNYHEFNMPAGNVTITVVFKAKHTITPVPEKAATCTEEGYEAHYKCSECDKLFSDAEGNNVINSPKVINKKGHDWDNGTETKAPTCEEKGTKTFRCSRCTETRTEDIDPLGHDWDDGTVTKEPTCEDKGVKTYTCSRCKGTTTEDVDPLGHKWNDGTVTKEATCTDTGTKHFECTRDGCNKTNDDTIKALGHKPKYVEEQPATKNSVGYYAHYECERDGCSKLFSDKDGKHEITRESITIPVLTHDLTLVPAKAATCTEDGYKAHYECKDDECGCGKKYEDPYGQKDVSDADIKVAALGHDPQNVDKKDPTCTANGYEKHYKCSRCKKLFSDANAENEISEPKAIAKLGHDLKHVAAKAETYKEDGNIEYYYCNRCKKYFKDHDCKNEIAKSATVIPKKGSAVLNEEAPAGDNMYKVTNPATDGTGTVTFTGVVTKKSSVSIPSTVEIKGSIYKVVRIGYKAFYKNTTTKTLSIGSNVKYIDSYAFYGCKNLTKVSGGNNLLSIGTKAFAYCSKLKSFSISSAVLKKISPYTFQKDKKLKTITIKQTTKLTKAGVKKSLKGSKVKKIKVKKSKVKAYKKIFKKSNSGRSVKVKK